MKKLITTALNETWGSGPYVFLGKWCLLPRNKNHWIDQSFEVLENQWNDREKIKRDYDYLKCLNERLLLSLTLFCNEFHNTSEGVEYWRKIIGPWLISYTSVLLDRWSIIKHAFEINSHYKYNQVENLENNPPVDYLDYFGKVQADRYNLEIFQDIILTEYIDKVEIEKIKIDNSTYFKKVFSIKNSCRRLAINFIDYLASIIDRGDIVIFESYFSKINYLKLILSLKRVPRAYGTDFSKNYCQKLKNQKKINRNQLVRIFKFQGNNKFEKFLSKRLIKDIPMAHLEYYGALASKVNSISLNPKKIFTANAHFNNEIFKLWVANKSNRGCQFFTLEHGASIPFARNLMDFEELVCDQRLTWSRPYHPKHKQLPASKLIGIKSASKLSGGYIGVIGSWGSRYMTRVKGEPISDQTFESISQVKALHGALVPAIRSVLKVRPFPESSEDDWNLAQSYKEALGNDLSIDCGSYKNFLEDAKLLLSTYPSTNFSESIVLNKPTILMYPRSLWDLSPEFNDIIRLLEEAKIIIYDPIEAAKHINSIWVDPLAWWGSMRVSMAIKIFKKEALGLNSVELKTWKEFIRFGE